MRGAFCRFSQTTVVYAAWCSSIYKNVNIKYVLVYAREIHTIKLTLPLKIRQLYEVNTLNVNGICVIWKKTKR